MNRSLHVTVLAGGPSAERAVSLRSGAAVARALRGAGHRVEEIDPLPGALRVPSGTDVVFVALHGSYGEDGTVQVELEELGIPYTGCGVAASLLAFDKVVTKRRCLAAGVPTAPFVVLNDASTPWPGEHWKPPVILKPTRQGSSVGLQFVDRVEDFAKSLEFSLRFGGEVLMEERIVGRETTVGILDDEALPVVEVRPKAGQYTYENKYTSGATEYFCPAEFDEATTRRIQEAGLGAFRAIGGRDYGRVDVMVRADGSPVVLEVNTLPGMTETSLLPKAAAARGYGFEALCQRMLDLALARSGKAGTGGRA